MKKTLFSLIIIMSFAVACTPQSSETTPTTQEECCTEATTSVSNSIAYIDIDSLMIGYELYDELRSAYEIKVRTAENALERTGSKLEKDIMDYQEKIQKGLITRATAASMEEDLGKRQQAFLAQRDKAMAELAEQEQVLLRQIQYSITEYLKEYNKDYRYAMIFSNSTTTPVLHANPAINITKEVKQGLNKVYQANKK